MDWNLELLLAKIKDWALRIRRARNRMSGDQCHNWKKEADSWTWIREKAIRDFGYHPAFDEITQIYLSILESEAPDALDAPVEAPLKPTSSPPELSSLYGDSPSHKYCPSPCKDVSSETAVFSHDAPTPRANLDLNPTAVPPKRGHDMSSAGDTPPHELAPQSPRHLKPLDIAPMSLSFPHHPKPPDVTSPRSFCLSRETVPPDMIFTSSSSSLRPERKPPDKAIPTDSPPRKLAPQLPRWYRKLPNMPLSSPSSRPARKPPDIPIFMPTRSRPERKPPDTPMAFTSSPTSLRPERKPPDIETTKLPPTHTSSPLHKDPSHVPSPNDPAVPPDRVPTLPYLDDGWNGLPISGLGKTELPNPMPRLAELR